MRLCFLHYWFCGIPINPCVKYKSYALFKMALLTDTCHDYWNGLKRLTWGAHSVDVDTAVEMRASPQDAVATPHQWNCVVQQTLMQGSYMGSSSWLIILLLWHHFQRRVQSLHQWENIVTDYCQKSNECSSVSSTNENSNRSLYLCYVINLTNKGQQHDLFHFFF